MPAMVPALFTPDGDTFVPAPAARSPWSSETLHGGSVAALLARAVEHRSPGDGRQFTRLTVELMRPVPVAPLRVEADVVRPGRKVQLIEASLWDGEAMLARARALLLRTTDAPVPEGARATGPVVPGPEQGRETPSPRGDYEALHNAGTEIRFVKGFFAEPGPATVWIRLRQPVVADEEPSPLQRVAAAADFGNGVSAVLDFSRWMFVNPDLTVYLNRLPVGEWVCLEARTEVEGHGIGMAHSRLHDERGPIGRSAQSLLLERL
ncbi:MAG: thioesterase family protein [Actinobacteria bacterium]|nr:MAG: thioesterase family protein [Actinomycetota bacterium]